MPRGVGKRRQTASRRKAICDSSPRSNVGAGRVRGIGASPPKEERGPATAQAEEAKQPRGNGRPRKTKRVAEDATSGLALRFAYGAVNGRQQSRSCRLGSLQKGWEEEERGGARPQRGVRVALRVCERLTWPFGKGEPAKGVRRRPLTQMACLHFLAPSLCLPAGVGAAAGAGELPLREKPEIVTKNGVSSHFPHQIITRRIPPLSPGCHWLLHR